MAHAATWSIGVGVIAFIIAIIFATIYYLKYKKLSIIVIIASIATYIFAVFYTWDVFDMNKNWILGMLAISAVIMLFLGKYFSNYKIEPVKMHTSLKEKKR